MNAADPKAVIWNSQVLPKPPFLRAPGMSSVMAWSRLAALLPILAAGFLSGPGAWLATLAAALAGAFAANLAAVAKKDFRLLPDAAALETALVFACMMPPGVPWILVLGGAFTGVVLFQKGLGFKGQYPFHPAVAVYVLLRLGFPVMMMPDVPAAPVSGMSRFFFCSGLGFGERMPLAVLTAGIFLVMLRSISLEGPLFFLAAWAAGSVLSGISPLPPGDILMAAFFLLTFWGTQPHTFKGRIVCALIGGGGAALFRDGMSYGPGGAAFALLMANAATPWLDRWIKPSGLRRLL